ncbi:class I SAM-dependent methyltransferase [Glycomyces harbinensis]|uniref:Methyltransferase domain-containing protein n=1 Tax=Glycomyces harbinensis TaxID=58114 RepID=A0A1G6RNZ1_9ACTN|nr:class I SAM-dependent methyltransferase [Glycomyces harbinensis]SDD06141.1 Methyltransferase domain-containing protein [Glycomyces harbinensis]
MAIDGERVMANYTGTGNLKSRIDIYRYRSPAFDPVDLAVELLPDDGLGLVLDVGAGTGRYTRRLRTAHPGCAVVAIDKSPGMLTEVEAPAMVADAQALPYPDDGADAVLAMHMLYHVPDIPAAVAEFRRVLKPGGTLLASTNAAGDMAEVAALWDRAARATVGPGAYSFGTAIENFDSASAPAPLNAVFDAVEEFRRKGLVAVPEPGPVLAFLASLRSWADCEDAAFDALLEAAAGELDGHFAEHATFDFTKTTVFYRCR